MVLESPLAFHPRVIGGTIAKAVGYAKTVWAFRKIMIEVRDAPDRTTYSDPAIVPQAAEEFAELALYHATTGGEAALARRERDETIRAGAAQVPDRRVAMGWYGCPPRRSPRLLGFRKP